MKNIRDLRQYISRKTTEQLINSLFTSHLDHTNSVLAGAPNATIKPLQRLQNQAAKLVLRRPRVSSSTQARCELHWLGIQDRVNFKVACIAHHCIHGKAPGYLTEMFALQTQKHAHRLRSSANSNNMYEVPQMRSKTFGDRSFAVQAPKLWNSLPRHIQEIADYKLF